MALSLKASICIGNNCRSLYFHDETGIYNATLNAGGWGSPNLAIASVTAWSIKITLPDTASTVITISNPAGLPSSNTDIEYEIPMATLNSSYTYIPDGQYKIVYSVTDGTTTYTKTLYKYFSCNLECCVAKLEAKVATATDCSCDDQTIRNALYARALLNSLKANAGCTNTTYTQSLLDKLNLICGFTESDCGCN